MPVASIERQLRQLLEVVMQDVLLDMRDIRFDRQDGAQLYAVCAYASIVEIVSGCQVLLNLERTSSLPILMRALLEQYADLRAGMVHRSYFKTLYASFLSEKLRLVRNAERAGDNAYLAPLAEAADLPGERAKLEAELAALAQEEHKPIDAVRRFELAGLEHEYRSMYWLLCLHGHNNLSALEDRHIERKDDDFSVTVFRNSDPEDEIRYLDSILGILFDASARIHSYLGATSESRMSRHWDPFAQIRDSYEHQADA